jgi:hypothetical protein
MMSKPRILRDGPRRYQIVHNLKAAMFRVWYEGIEQHKNLIEILNKVEDQVYKHPYWECIPLSDHFHIYGIGEAMLMLAQTKLVNTVVLDGKRIKVQDVPSGRFKDSLDGASCWELPDGTFKWFNAGK